MPVLVKTKLKNSFEDPLCIYLMRTLKLLTNIAMCAVYVMFTQLFIVYWNCCTGSNPLNSMAVRFCADICHVDCEVRKVVFKKPKTGNRIPLLSVCRPTYRTSLLMCVCASVCVNIFLILSKNFRLVANLSLQVEWVHRKS